MGQAGIRARKGLGQHFLLDERVAARAVEHAAPKGVGGGETVLEVGPGLGVLTVRLAEAFDRVVAVEADEALAEVLVQRLERADGGTDRVEVVVGDALKVDLPPTPEAVVANLPYQISSPLTFRLLDHGFGRAVLMYQKEFAERLVAGPGSKRYSRLSVNAALRADAEVLETVARGAFWPQPKVQGALVRLTMRPPPFHVADERLFFAVTHALFTHRRKQAKNALALDLEGLGVSEAALEAAVEAWGLADKRPEQLQPEEMAELANLLAGKGR